ncbi:hypothetical protein TNCT_296001 [Trichonephila clavata]|uniref:Uncharacterized protein n=1 Tax=Trichonephila clavata TaxID=2740835 RepID=A0A8X6J0V0_TRICU|nr:hypothetical protein TNCT_296001 [Trichonephila clavata]
MGRGNLGKVYEMYGIKKKEEVQEQDPFADMEGSSLNRKRKTPAELAAEAEAEDQDEFTKLKNSLETQVSELKSTIEGKCNLQ